MPRLRRKPRIKNQEVTFVVRHLKKIIKDRNAPYSVRLKCLDRLANIDRIYNVDITPTYEPTPDVEAAAVVESDIDKMLREVDEKLGGGNESGVS